MAELQRAGYLVEPGKVELRQVPVPRPGPGEVLLRVERALAGGTDRKAFLRGHPQIPMPGPFGHRYAGTVARLGAGAPAFDIGQPVMGVHSAPCLRCDLCRKERWNLCPDVMKEKVLGAFAQYLCIPAPIARHNLFPRPPGLSADHATFLEPLACVVHALEMIDWAGVERVFILGLGSMGLLFAQLLPQYTTAQLGGAGRRPERLQLARRFGLEQVWDASELPPTESLSNSERFDCVIECTGNLDGWQQALDRTAAGGQVVMFGGLPKGTLLPVDSYRLHYEDLRLVGSFHFSPRDVARARDWLVSGALELEPLISGRAPLAELADVMRKLAEGQGMQYVVDPW
jgi:L-iditol 2-dehydrogenase